MHVFPLTYFDKLNCFGCLKAPQNKVVFYDGYEAQDIANLFCLDHNLTLALADNKIAQSLYYRTVSVMDDEEYSGSAVCIAIYDLGNGKSLIVTADINGDFADLDLSRKNESQLQYGQLIISQTYNTTADKVKDICPDIMIKEVADLFVY